MIRATIIARTLFALGVAFGLTSGWATGAAADEGLLERGEHVFRAAGCLSCHTDFARGGRELAGGRALKTPFGTFHTPNISPDPATGIGAWTDEDFLGAVRHGVGPGGAPYYPAFPYTSYTLMRDDDALALKAYLFSRPPVVRENTPHDLNFPFNLRFLMLGWRLLFFNEGPFEPLPDASEEINRGAYLVDALAHCGECHTARNPFGAVDGSQYLAGNRDGPDREIVPNLTPDTTGLAGWSQADIVYLLRTGFRPNFDNVQGSMAEVIKHGLKYLSDADLKAIAAYLAAIPPIENTLPTRR